MRNVISIADLTNDEIEEIFSLADSAGRLRADRAAGGQIMATLFYEPSTRTRLSFESAMQRLGGSVISCSDMKASSTAKGETIADTRQGRFQLCRCAGGAASLGRRRAGDGGARRCAGNQRG